VFDRVDAGADGVADARGAVGVGGDPQAPHMGLVSHGGQLGQGHLLLARLGVAREDAAGGADLDHLGTVFAHLADGAAGRLDTVGVERIGLGQRARHAGDVAMAARGAERGTRRNDPRPFDEATVDGLTQGDVGEIRTAQIPHRGEAGHQIGAGMADLQDRPEVVGVVQLVPAGHIGRRGQVDVHVDQAGQQGQARQIQPTRVSRQVGRHGRADRGDPAVGDDHHGVIDIAPALDIDHAGGGDDEGVGVCGRRPARAATAKAAARRCSMMDLPCGGEARMAGQAGQPSHIRPFPQGEGGSASA
jgi:hypothetical protein